MKKVYVKPRMIVADMGSNESLLQSSYTNIGGKTDEFNVRVRGNREIWGESEE